MVANTVIVIVNALY